jgi:hypothetical protein
VLPGPLTPAVDKPAVRVVERGHRAHAVVAGLGELLASYRLAGEGRDLNAETFGAESERHPNAVRVWQVSSSPVTEA